MGDFGREEMYAPDSELDSDQSVSVSVVINDGTTCLLYKNDWVDTVENILPLDPYWGYAFQISNIVDNQIFIKVLDTTTDVYREVAISAEVITNAYRHVEKT